MAEYYVNAAGSFDATSVGSEVDPFTGPWGLFEANLLSGLTTYDSIFCQGTLISNRLTKLTVDEDKTSTWVVGDIVENNIGSGDDWTGILCAIDATTMKIELTVSNVYVDVDIADGISNTTRTETTTISDKSGIYFEPISVKHIGTNSSFVREDGVYFGIDCGGVADYGIVLRGSGRIFFNFSCENAVYDGLHVPTYYYYCAFFNCKFNYNGRYGCYNNNLNASYVFNCTFDHNGSYGKNYDTMYSANIWHFCSFSHNGSSGVREASKHEIFLQCIAHNNNGYGIDVYTSGNQSGFIIMSTIDGNDSGIGRNYCRLRAFFNRITNNTNYGINGSNNTSSQLNYHNLFFNNGNDLPYAFVELGENKTDSISDGYTDQANSILNLTEAADYRDITVTLPS